MKVTAFTLALLISITTSPTVVADNAKKKSPKENQIEIEKKAEIAREQRKLEEAEVANEKSRWIWRFDLTDGEVIWLHSSDRPWECKGNLSALKTRWQMGDHQKIKDLCWYQKGNDKFITIVDPGAYIFSTTRIDAAKLTYLQSDRERRLAKQAEDERRQAEANRILLNNLADYMEKREKESREFNRALLQNSIRPAILCNDMGGGMSICN